MSCQKCLDLNIPERLCSEGKNKAIPFEIGEVVYRRYNQIIEGRIIDLDLKVVEQIFQLENDSHNRSSLSEPTDVLINDKGESFLKYGILSIPIDDIEKEMTFEFQNSKVKSLCSLKVIYDPTECNFAHCEIQCFIDGVRRIEGKPPKSAKPFFRRELQKIMKVVKYIDIN